MPSMATSSITPMQIATSRFGVIDATESEIVEFENGVLGFPDATQFLRVPIVEADGWLWLQSTTDPELAFLAISAFMFFPDYDLDLPDGDAEAIGLDDSADAEVLALVTVRRTGDEAVDSITANLLGPIVVNNRTLRGRQVVLSDSQYSTRETVSG